MDTPIERYLRMGIVHYMAFPELASGSGPWEETLRHIALDHFFTGIEITHIEDQQVRKRVRDLIRLAHLSVGYGAQPAILGQGLDLNSLEEDTRVHACKLLKEHMDEATYMGAESFIILSGKDPGTEKRPQAITALIKSFGELCAYSASRGGPVIVAEIFDCEVDKCCLLGPSLLAEEIAGEVRKQHDNFGLLVDLSHIPLLKESPQQALIPVKEYLVGAHLGNAVIDHDCAGYGDNHPTFGTPGGANDLPEVAAFLRTLMDVGFLDGKSRPIVSFEIKPLEGQSPLVAVANAKRVLTQAWALV